MYGIFTSRWWHKQQQREALWHLTQGVAEDYIKVTGLSCATGVWDPFLHSEKESVVMKLLILLKRGSVSKSFCSTITVSVQSLISNFSNNRSFCSHTC